MSATALITFSDVTSEAMIIHGYFFTSDLVKFENGREASLYREPTKFDTFKVEVDSDTIEIKKDATRYIVIKKKP